MAPTERVRYGGVPPLETLEALEAEIHHHVARIAEDLRMPPPHTGAHAAASRRAISRAIGSYFGLLSGNAAEKPGTPPPRTAFPTAQATRYRALRAWAETWPRIEALLAAQIPPVRRPLYPTFDTFQDSRMAQTRMNDATVGTLHYILNPAAQSESGKELGAYADIALPMSSFLAHLHAACRVLLAQGRTTRTRFLDVGCGGGMKVLAAAPYFAQATGLEFDAGYVSVARGLMACAPFSNTDIVEANALEFGGYDAFDVIYFYRPMRHPEVLARMERQIVGGARPGTLVIAPYDMFRPNAPALGCARIDGQLYITGRSQAEADTLRRLAEFSGPAIAPPRPDLPPVWDPILGVSRLKGFAP